MRPTSRGEDDVIRMVRAKLSPDVVITTIESNNFAFDLSPGGLIRLKETGVDDPAVADVVLDVDCTFAWDVS